MYYRLRIIKKTPIVIKNYVLEDFPGRRLDKIIN